MIRAPRPLLIALTVVVDLTIAISIASGTARLVHVWLGLDSVISLAAIIGAVILLYVGGARAESWVEQPANALTGVR